MKDQLLNKNDICAIIVCFNPDSNFPKRVKTLLEQVNDIVIVDNHSTNRAISETLQNMAYHPSIHLIINNDNFGIATALNQGVSYAKQLDYSWVLLLDQDTTPGKCMVETLICAYGMADNKEKIAIIGANYTDNPSRIACNQEISCLIEPKTTVITSGSLLSISAFDIIGCFRDNFFIDSIDLEYCLRARAKGFGICRTISPLMLHSIGFQSTHRFFTRATGTSNHSSARRYYMYRNHVVLIKEYFLAQPKWILQITFAKLKSIILICLFEKDKMSKLKAIFLGIVHGIKENFSEPPTM